MRINIMLQSNPLPNTEFCHGFAGICYKYVAKYMLRTDIWFMLIIVVLRVLLCKNANTNLSVQSPGSSVSTVSGYGLDDWVKEVRSPAEAKGFFL
jgi:hypothetical protein